MSREDQHRDKAAKNETFAESLNCNDPVQESWAVVCAFYSALHYVQSYFSRFSVDVGTHDGRFDQMKRDEKLRPAFTSYKYLYDLSRTARYHCVGMPAAVYSKEARPRLKTVKAQIDHALGTVKSA
jgi:hypothetical protein